MAEIYMSLAGISCKELGLHCKTHRPVLPDLSESLLEVSGRDGSYDYGNNSYRNRTISVDFYISRENFKSFRLDIRRIAAWLRRKGEIRFSDEPDKYYYGRCYQSPMLEQAFSSSGTFSVSFLCEPFAYGTGISEGKAGISPVNLPLSYPGTYPSCCKIIIRNTGTTPISNIRIQHNIESD